MFLDYSVTENFFDLLKTEMSYKHAFKSTEHLISESESYTDDYINSRIKVQIKRTESCAIQDSVI